MAPKSSISTENKIGWENGEVSNLLFTQSPASVDCLEEEEEGGSESICMYRS